MTSWERRWLTALYLRLHDAIAMNFAFDTESPPADMQDWLIEQLGLLCDVRNRIARRVGDDTIPACTDAGDLIRPDIARLASVLRRARHQLARHAGAPEVADLIIRIDQELNAASPEAFVMNHWEIIQEQAATIRRLEERLAAAWAALEDGP